MRTLLLLLAFIACILYQVGALTCLEKCEQSKCNKDFSACKHGITKDVCFCCDVCAKGLGEPCGGQWNLWGRCASGLTCQPNPKSKALSGKCIKQL
ncbi:hypothetical protein CHUAL_009966 [Chamberlinius hualienensis]